MNGAMIASIMGAFLVVTGTIIAGIHVLNQKNLARRIRQEGIEENIGRWRIKLSTFYPGTVLVALGIFLLAIGAITWK